MRTKIKASVSMFDFIRPYLGVPDYSTESVEGKRYALLRVQGVASVVCPTYLYIE